MPTDSSAVLEERRDDVVTITLDRPEKRNALAVDVMEMLTAALRRAGDTDALGVVIAANGPVFSAGHNFGDLAGASFEEAQHVFDVCTEMMTTIQALPQPVCARVHALATAAGCQLVASCDLAVAAESAGFAIPGGKGGLFCHTPLVAVARSIGRKRALEMAFTGDPIDAATAADWGLINRVVPDDLLDAAVDDLMQRATRGSPRLQGPRQAGLLPTDRPQSGRRVRVRRPDDVGGGDDRRCPRRRSPPSSRSASRSSNADRSDAALGGEQADSLERPLAAVAHRARCDLALGGQVGRRPATDVLAHDGQIVVGEPCLARFAEHDGQLLERRLGLREPWHVEPGGGDEVLGRPVLSPSRRGERPVAGIVEQSGGDVARSAIGPIADDRQPSLADQQVEGVDAAIALLLAADDGQQTGQQTLQDDAGGERILGGDDHEAAEHLVGVVRRADLEAGEA